MKAVVEMLAGHAAAEVLYGLLRSGVLDDLRLPHTADELATAHHLDPTATRVALEFVARTTGVVKVKRGQFALAPDVAASTTWRALLEKFVGAYGPAIRDPISHLRSIDRAGATIDQAALTRAFAANDESPAVVDSIVELEPKGVLDLGCGRGALLAQVCAGRSIRGWGIDRSTTMCRAARARLAAQGLDKQVKIRQASAHDLGRALSAADRKRVDVLYAASLLNEWMADESMAVAILARLGTLFPGRSLVVVDYLGALGRGRRAGPYTHITDLVQSLTGQGVAPSSHGSWERIYRAAGARLVGASESNTLDLRWFVHVVTLGGLKGRQ
jgi:SAM-dependent methyltransferase